MTLNITYGMLNVICAISTVLNPREIPNAINASIREIPVTISEFSDRDVVDSHDDGARNPFHAVDADGGDRADDGRDQSDANAMSSVLFKAFMMAESWNICVYQRVVKPPQTVLDFVLLKDKTIMVTIGCIKKSKDERR